jgi:integrase
LTETLREYARYARKDGELSFWGKRSILAVTSDELDRWNASLAERGLSPKTRRHVIGALRTCFRWAMRTRRLQEPVWPSISVPEYEPQIITPQQQDAILEAIPEIERGAFLIACHMGLRPSEIRALEPADYFKAPDEEFAGLRVCKAMDGNAWDAEIGPTKNKRNRNLPVPLVVAEWIEAHWTAATRLSAEPLTPMLINPRTGRRWSHWALRQSWLKASKAALGRAVPLYEGTKHSGATAMLQRSRDIEAVREYLGHSDARSTRKYAHLTSGALVDIAKGRKS